MGKGSVRELRSGQVGKSIRGLGEKGGCLSLVKGNYRWVSSGNGSIRELGG